MSSTPSRTKKNGTPNWPAGHHGRHSRDRGLRKATKSIPRRTVKPAPILSEAELLEAQGLSPALSRENRSSLAQSDSGNSRHQIRSKVPSTGASGASLSAVVQRSDANKPNADDVYPHIEIDLGRAFLDFVRENHDLIKAYNSRLPYIELDLSQRFLRFTSENHGLVQAFISRTTRQGPAKPPAVSSKGIAVLISPRPPLGSVRTIPNSTASSDETDNNNDASPPPQPVVDLKKTHSSQHIAAAMKTTGLNKLDLLNSYGRGEVAIGGQWAQQVNRVGAKKCHRCRELAKSPCTQVARGDAYYHGIACVRCRTMKMKCSFISTKGR